MAVDANARQEHEQRDERQANDPAAGQEAAVGELGLEIASRPVTVERGQHAIGRDVVCHLKGSTGWPCGSLP
jgi:hypothetical protein